MRASTVALGAGALTWLASLVPIGLLVATFGSSLAVAAAEAAVRHGDVSTVITLALAVAAPVLLLVGLALRARGRLVYSLGAASLVVLLASTVARLPRLITAPVAAYVAVTCALALVSLAAIWWPPGTPTSDRTPRSRV